MTRKERYKAVIEYFEKALPDAETELNFENAYQLLVAVILSAQCTDKRVNLTTPAFCRFFKANTRMTFTDFVNQFRINQAKNLLLQDRSVSEACFAVGFESLSYFNKLFRKVVGENPSEFKKRHLR